MIWPSTRLLTFAVLKAVTVPRPDRYTGTSCLTTGATATETERGPAAWAFCCFVAPLLHPRRAEDANKAHSPTNRGMSANLAFDSEESFIFTGFSVAFCRSDPVGSPSVIRRTTFELGCGNSLAGRDLFSGRALSRSEAGHSQVRLLRQNRDSIRINPAALVGQGSSTGFTYLYPD